MGQKNDTNIITNDERLRPAVVVSDGFATNAGDLVTVYVDLENNPGVNGANFGIRYDQRLELVDWYEGEFFSATSTEASHAVSCGYNFVWGNEAAKTGKGGNLLELVFRLPYDATTQDSYEVAVVYSVVAGSEGGFALPSDVCATLNIPANRPQKFKTKDGVIRLVDRLPGDVDNSNAVNLRDALYLSNCLVNEEDYPITREIKQYGDVNLDAMVTINDVVKVLQSISGGYGASLLSPEYRIQLNANGYAYDPDALFVHLYGANNTYAALADIEEAMMQREGYKFLGWYTRLEGGVKIDAANYQTQLVSYDQDQKIQTLYAHWQKNSVSFDMNGATSEWLDKETYLGNGEQWITLIAPVEEYTVIFADPNNQNIRQAEKLSRTFAYWLGSDGVKYYAGDRLPVHKLNMGELTLTAQWNEWTLNFPALEKTGYDANQITWYTNAYLTDELDGDVYETIKAMSNKVLYAKWTAPNTYYVHYDANGGSGAMDNSAHQYDFATQLSSNAFTRQYTVTFNYGWSGQSNSTLTKTHIFQGWSRDGKTLIENNMAYNWTAEHGKVITVYAVWDIQSVELPMPNSRTGYSFGGWYLDANFTRPAGNGQAYSDYETTGECTLYAKWQKNEYTVTLDVNGGTGASGTFKVYYDEAYNSQGYILPTPTRTGHIFTGWLNVEAGKIVTATDLVAVARDHTLRAQWEACTITLNANGGTVSKGSITMSGAGTYSGLPVPERANHGFVGWYYGDTKVTESTYAVTAGNHTLTAKWVALSWAEKRGDGFVKRFRMIDDRESFWVDFAEDWNPNVSKQDLVALGYTKVSIKLDFNLKELTQGNFRVYFATPASTEMFRWSFTDNPSGWTTYNEDSAKDGTYIDISEFGDNMEFKTIWEAYGYGGDSYDLGETTITLTFHK